MNGLKARTKILELMEDMKRETTIKELSSMLAALSYRSILHHLHLLEGEKIVKRTGKRPYRWSLTGKGQRRIVHDDEEREWE